MCFVPTVGIEIIKPRGVTAATLRLGRSAERRESAILSEATMLCSSKGLGFCAFIAVMRVRFPHGVPKHMYNKCCGKCFNKGNPKVCFFGYFCPCHQPKKTAKEEIDTTKPRIGPTFDGIYEWS